MQSDSEDVENTNPEGSGDDEASNNDGPRTRSGKKKRKKQYRFNKQSDRILIMEVEKWMPFLEDKKTAVDLWKKIAEVLNDQFMANITYSRAQLRFKLLIGDFNKEDFANRYKSGTEEEITELKDKLTNLSSLMKDRQELVEEEVVEKSKKASEEKAVAEDIRSSAVNTFKRKSVENDGGTPKRPTEKSLVDLWKDKQTQDRIFEDKRLEVKIQQKKEDRGVRLQEIALEKEKLEFEKQKADWEQKKHTETRQMEQERFELEKQERQAQIKMQETLLSLIASIKK